MSKADPNAKPTLVVAWFALLVGPMAWSAQLGVAWVADEFGCGPGGGGEGIYGVSHGAIVATSVLIATVLGALGIIAGFVTWRRFRSARDDAGERAAWMGLAGLITSAVFVVATIPGVLGPVYLAGCTTAL